MSTYRFLKSAVLLAGAVTLLAGCGNLKAEPPINLAAKQNTSEPKQEPSKEPSQTPAQQPSQTPPAAEKPASSAAKEDYTSPNSIAVLVNKQFGLPLDYKPADLVDDPNLPFIFSGKDEKRLIRKEAAEALEKLFSAAKKDNIFLAGVSAYRSSQTQQGLFNSYIQIQGEAEARKYSAVPGFSEHQTGLAIDVSGSSGACAAENCFGDTPEAKWLADHAHEHGFIIRYLQGKEAVTGYAYEPWHLRYVGQAIAKKIHEQGITLEEYVKHNSTSAQK
ncbi:MAG: D-alanyl-D-alanine carboxypeptidase family protein [Tumebacillaceae bacterium]